MKKITWITADYFTETDLNYSVLSLLCQRYVIEWFIIEGSRPYFEQKQYREVTKIENLHIHFMSNPYRTRDPRCILFYLKLYKKIKAAKGNIVYYNVGPNPASAFMLRLINPQKLICTAHDGKAQNDSARFGLMRTWAYNMTFHHAQNINMFSQAQANLMRQTYGERNIHIMKLPLKHFGEIDDRKSNSFIRFLSFGHIIYQKNIDLLIEAGNLLYEKGYRNFKISINGTCENWEFYSNKIRHPEIFECCPDFITNEQLLELFSTSHYAVFPYRRVSQSGVLKVAFNYNIPVIVSRIGSFLEEVREGVNGFYFEASNVESLVSVMEARIINFDKEYDSLREKMSNYTKDNYSIESVVAAYTELFESI